jgi:Protein of unknown function (DUF3052)
MGDRGRTADARDQPSQKPLLDKLGVKEGFRVSILGAGSPGFVEDLRARGASVTMGRTAKDSDLIFVHVDHRDDLDDALAPLEPSLKRNGAVWVIRPKGSKDIKEVDVIAAGLRAGFVDNKIASFSDTLSAMRLVIPVAQR